MRLVIAEVVDACGWPARVSALLAREAAAGDQLLLLVPPPLLADCRALSGRRAEVLAHPSADLGTWLRDRRPADLAWLPAGAAYSPPDWEGLRGRARRVMPWLPRWDLPRDRQREYPMPGPVGWLATGDVVDVAAGRGWPSFLPLADHIHRHRLPVEIASARIAADAPAPLRAEAPGLHEGSRILAVVPHFRCEAWLATALASLQAQTRPPDGVVVIDDGSPDPPAAIVAQFPGCTLLAAAGTHGPYRLVQQVITDTDYDGYLFQDADDWSAHDRLALLLAAAARGGADLVGCQEGRWQADRMDVCCLFPADASHALAAAPVHALLHPTGLVSRAFVRRAGGYATGLRFFGDAEFLWRAHPWGTIANMPFVSYFRQARADSLTGSPETGHESPARVHLKVECKRRFWQARAARARGERPPPVPYRTAPPVVLRHVCGPSL